MEENWAISWDIFPFQIAWKLYHNFQLCSKALVLSVFHGGVVILFIRLILSAFMWFIMKLYRFFYCRAKTNVSIFCPLLMVIWKGPGGRGGEDIGLWSRHIKISRGCRATAYHRTCVWIKYILWMNTVNSEHTCYLVIEIDGCKRLFVCFSSNGGFHSNNSEI